MDGGRPAKACEDKTEIILIGTQQQLDKVNIAHLEIGQASVLIVSSALRNDGSWFDVNLKITEQISKTCQSVYYYLHNIKQIRKFLTPTSTKLLIQGVIIARIDYCNGLLYSVLAVIRSATYHPYTQLPSCYPDAACPPLGLVKFPICYKIAVISFKAIHSLGPAYLSR